MMTSSSSAVHSLLAVQLISRMHAAGLHGDVRDVFDAPTLAGLAANSGKVRRSVAIPPNLIVPGSTHITPTMLTLIHLEQEDIDRIVAHQEGGAANVQDLYPLAPLQEGILFHHRAQGQGDNYLLPSLLRFESRAKLERFADALQQVVNRHDVLRTAFFWEGLDEPVQVVLCRAALKLEEVVFERGGDVGELLKQRYDPQHHRIDVSRAPLLRGIIAEDAPNQSWLLLMLVHHLVLDHQTLEQLMDETLALEAGNTLPVRLPVPFRNFVAQARLGVSREEHETFFRELLGDVDEPTLPFGLSSLRGDFKVGSARVRLDGRDRARRPRTSTPMRRELCELDARRLGFGRCAHVVSR